MLQKLVAFLRRHQRATISRQLDHVYADMRAATERAVILKKLAEQQEAETLAALRELEQQLIRKANRMDLEDTMQSVAMRAARAW